MSAEPGAYRVALPEFEGPLDLLLHLCKTHEIDIVNIPIAFITEKYLEYLDVMQSMPFDVAADYLVMAATLAYLKSRELVPTPEPLEATGDEEDGEVLDPREELIRRLLEYQKYKDAAEQLGSRPIEGRTVFGRGVPLEAAAEAPMSEQSVWKLIESFGRILEKASGPKRTHDVVVDRISIGVRMTELLDRIEAGQGSFRFESCFDLSLSEPELRHQVVATLLAILELAKLKVVRVLQSPEGDTLFITQASGVSMQAARQAAQSAVSSDGRPAEEKPAGEPSAGASTAVAQVPAEAPGGVDAAGQAVVEEPLAQAVAGGEAHVEEPPGDAESAGEPRAGAEAAGEALAEESPGDAEATGGEVLVEELPARTVGGEALVAEPSGGAEAADEPRAPAEAASEALAEESPGDAASAGEPRAEADAEAAGEPRAEAEAEAAEAQRAEQMSAEEKNEQTEEQG